MFPSLSVGLSWFAFRFCGKLHDQKPHREERASFSLCSYSTPLRETRAGTHGKALAAGTEAGTRGVLLTGLLPIVCSVCFLIQPSAICLEVAQHIWDLGAPMSVTNQEKALQTGLQANQREVFSQRKLLLLR